jgi:hypothetical protein
MIVCDWRFIGNRHLNDLNGFCHPEQSEGPAFAATATVNREQQSS